MITQNVQIKIRFGVLLEKLKLHSNPDFPNKLTDWTCVLVGN